MDFLTNTNIQFYIISYLIGAIPFGLILTKKFTNVDIQKNGSKSIGATNVLRVIKIKNKKLAKKLSIATLVLDTLKGMSILIIALLINLDYNTLWTIGILSILGHCYSIYIGFEGGKGVATGLGVLLILIPIPTLISIVSWIIFAKTIKISSISSILSLIVLVIASHILDNISIQNIESFAPLYIITFVIIYKHLPNIVRLINKKEEKVI
jgi:acyl phosphate:glycerol-3-phosphate acyltransferase